jgi:hypothetical protein
VQVFRITPTPTTLCPPSSDSSGKTQAPAFFPAFPFSKRIPLSFNATNFSATRDLLLQKLKSETRRHSSSPRISTRVMRATRNVRWNKLLINSHWHKMCVLLRAAVIRTVLSPHCFRICAGSTSQIARKYAFVATSTCALKPSPKAATIQTTKTKFPKRFKSCEVFNTKHSALDQLTMQYAHIINQNDVLLQKTSHLLQIA